MRSASDRALALIIFKREQRAPNLRVDAMRHSLEPVCERMAMNWLRLVMVSDPWHQVQTSERVDEPAEPLP